MAGTLAQCPVLHVVGGFVENGEGLWGCHSKRATKRATSTVTNSGGGGAAVGLKNFSANPSSSASGGGLQTFTGMRRANAVDALGLRCGRNYFQSPVSPAVLGRATTTPGAAVVVAEFGEKATEVGIESAQDEDHQNLSVPNFEQENSSSNSETGKSIGKPKTSLGGRQVRSMSFSGATDSHWPGINRIAGGVSSSSFCPGSIPSSVVGKRAGQGVMVDRREPPGSKLHRVKKLLERLETAEPTDEAVQAAMEGWASSISPTDMSSVISNLKWTKACAFFKWLLSQGYEPNLFVYNVLLGTFRAGGVWNMADEFGQQMLADGLTLDNYTFSTLIRCALQCARPLDALRWFDKMHELGCVPDEVTYSTMALVYSRLGRFDDGVELYERLRETGWKLDKVSFGTMINAYSRVGNYLKALALVREMQQVGIQPEAVVYDTLIEYFAREGKTGQAKEVFLDMERAEVKPSKYTLSLLIDVHGRAGETKDAFRLFTRLKEEKLPVDVSVYNSLLKMCAEVRLVCEAENLLAEIVERGLEWDDVTYKSTINLYANEGRIKDAEKVANRMVEVGLNLDMVVYSCLMKAYGISRDFNRAATFFERMLADGCEVEDKCCGVLLSLMKMCETVEDRSIVMGCLERSKPVLSGVVNLLLAGDLQKNELQEQVQNLLLDSEPDSYRPFCNALVDLCWSLNKKDRARDLVSLADSRIVYPGLFLRGWDLDVSLDVDDEPDINKDRSKSGSLASTPETAHDELNGENDEAVHMAVPEVDVGQVENFLPTNAVDASVLTEISHELHYSSLTLNMTSALVILEVNMNGTSSSLKSEFVDTSTTGEASSKEFISNRALNGLLRGRLDTPKPAIEASVLDHSVEERLVEADEEGKVDFLVNGSEKRKTDYGVAISVSVQPTSDHDCMTIIEKRAELARIINALGHRSTEDFLGKVNGQRLPTSLLHASEIFHSENISAARQKKRKLKISTTNSSGFTQSLSEVLPVKKSGSPEVYLKVYEKLLQAGRIQDCVVLLEEMDKLKIFDEDKIYHSKFFKACQKQKAVREAFRFLRLLSRPTLSSYNMLLCVCRDAQDIDGGLRVLSATEKAGFKPDAILYTTLISTCAKAGKVDIAFKVFHDMQTAGVIASTETYGAMIDGCALAGQVAKAFGVYGIMISKQLKPDHVIFNTLINACGRSGAIERAFDVLADMKAEPCFLSPNHVTMGALISACARAGQVDRAFEVYKNMRECGIKGTPECYSAAVHACSPTGNLALALSVFEDMKRDSVKPDEIFFSALIDVAGHSEQVDHAFSILEEMKKVNVTPGAITYSALMGVCCNTGNWERGLEFYKIVRAANFLPTVSTYNALVTALCDAKQIEQSFSVFQEMKEAGVKADQITYSILLNACEKLDEPERAFDLYTSGRADGIVPNEAMCASVIALCYARIKKKHSYPNYPCSIGLLAGQSNEAPYEQWASWAVAVYRHAVAANVVPTVKSLSLLLGCLRTPEAKHEKNLFDDTYSHSGNSWFHPSSILEGAGFCDPRALALFEEAASMGVVPHLNYTAGPVTVNAESMPSYVAEVYLVTLLKGLKQRHMAGAQLFPVTINYSTETRQTVTATKEVKEITVSGRTGQGVAALLRRLRLHYHGHESSGKLRIDTASIRKWLKPAATFPSLQRHHELGPLGPPHTFLAQGIAEQQRAIRMGHVFKNSADIERVSSDSPIVYMYRNRSRISQVNPWDRGDTNDFDFTDTVTGLRKNSSRKGTSNKRRP